MGPLEKRRMIHVDWNERVIPVWIRDVIMYVVNDAKQPNSHQPEREQLPRCQIDIRHAHEAHCWPITPSHYVTFQMPSGRILHIAST